MFQQFARFNSSLMQCFWTILLQRNLPQMFTLLMDPNTMIQMSVLPQPHRIVVANFVRGNFVLLRWNPWIPKVPQNHGWKTLPYCYKVSWGHIAVCLRKNSTRTNRQKWLRNMNISNYIPSFDTSSIFVVEYQPFTKFSIS